MSLPPLPPLLAREARRSVAPAAAAAAAAPRSGAVPSARLISEASPMPRLAPPWRASLLVPAPAKDASRLIPALIPAKDASLLIPAPSEASRRGASVARLAPCQHTSPHRLDGLSTGRWSMTL
eukprot:353017-Chlamydomonas_euryale.AAC.13